MVIYIDENLSPHIADALDALENRKTGGEEVSVRSIQKAFSKGLKDPELIPLLGSENAIWITRDKRLLRRKAELKLILDYKIGLFVLTPSWAKKSYWDLVKLMVNKWEELKGLCNQPRPFLYKIDGHGKFIEVDFDYEKEE